MSVFPLVAAVAVLIDGTPLPAYVQPYRYAGRVFAPLRPYVTVLADRIWYDGDSVLIERDGRTVRVRLARRPSRLDRTFVAIAPVWRALGERVVYDARRHLVEVTTPVPAAVASPSPFDPRAPQAPVSEVFTPAPLETPRPVWSGPALPRRTPIPYPSPER